MVSIALLYPSLSKVPSSFKNLSRFIEARLQALLSMCIYSEQGFDAVIGPVLGQVCQSFMVVSYCMPGSAECHAASEIHPMMSFALTFSSVSPVVTALRSQSSSFSTARINSSETLTELFAF